MTTVNEKIEEIIILMQKGKVNEVNNLINECLEQGAPAVQILNDGLLSAMQIVADKWAEGKAFIPEVLICARCLNSGLQILDPELTKEKVESKGVVVLGTVKTDLHDIGKNLVGLMLKSKGFEVIDIGVDADSKKFTDAIKTHKPKYVCLSALLTTSMPYMKNIVADIISENLNTQLKICVGGAPVTLAFCQEIGADIYEPDAISLAERLIKLER